MIIARILIRQGQCRVLIICTKSSVGTWEVQIDKHINTDVQPVTILTAKQCGFLNSTPLKNILQVLIIPYDTARARIGIIRKLRPDIIICDESHHIAGRTSSRSKAIGSLDAPYKLILTGTPIDKDEADLWPQFRFLDPDILGPWNQFVDNYCRRTGWRWFNPWKGEWEGTQVQVVRSKALMRKLKSHCARVSKAVLGLPPRIEQDIYVDLGPKASKIYQALERDYIYQSKGQVIAEPFAGAMVTRLQQITGGWVKFEQGYKSIDNAKLEALRDLFTVYMPGRKVVVFARFIPELKDINRLCEDLGRSPVMFYGKTKNRKQIWTDFQSTDKYDTFIAQIDTGGESIELFDSNVVIFYSLSYRYRSYEQAIARLERSGQTQKVTIIRIIARNSIDIAVWDTICDKSSTATSVMRRLEMARKAKTQEATKVTKATKTKATKAAEVEEAPKRRGPPLIEKPTYGVDYVADKLGIDPRAARIKLRDAGVEREGKLYDFKTAKGANAVVDQLKGTKKKAA